MATREFAILLVIMATMSPPTVHASDFTAGPLIQVSGVTPFASCTATAARI